MSEKKSKKVVAISFPNFHLQKLEVMCMKLGVSKSEMLRRMIEDYKLFGEEKQKGD